MIIKLTELLHAITEEEKSGLVNVDNWRYPDIDHLVTMGFEFSDDYHMITGKPPKMTIYKKKDKDDTGKEVAYFFIEEDGKKPKRFKNFNDVIDFFDHYEQDLDKNQ